jgi:AmmeMemoRadiSam system protein A
MDTAGQAALRDPRFPPVEPDELPRLRVEISVLTQPEPLTFHSPEELLAKLQPGRDGVVLRVGGRMATFLPQVWAQVSDKTSFMNQLALKAGFPPSTWRGPDATVSIYHAESFAEEAEPLNERTTP